MTDLFDAAIDLSHHNSVDDFATVAASGVAAVVHKRTQGVHYVDPAYEARRELARNAGLLWGAYHFGDGSDGGAQAKAFLSRVRPGEDLLVLDLEANPAGPSMPLSEAHAFVVSIFNETGAYPGLYAGHYLKDLLGSAQDEILSNCWLWLAHYTSHPVVHPTWDDWTLWQYTDGVAGPNPVPVPGIGACDRDAFNGSPAGVGSDASGLTAFWTKQLGI